MFQCHTRARARARMSKLKTNILFESEFVAKRPFSRAEDFPTLFFFNFNSYILTLSSIISIINHYYPVLSIILTCYRLVSRREAGTPQSYNCATRPFHASTLNG